MQKGLSAQITVNLAMKLLKTKYADYDENEGGILNDDAIKKMQKFAKYQ